MKKSILSLLVFSFFHVQLKAQSTDEPILINVTYQFIHVNDLNDKDNPTKTDMVLSIGKKSSRYLKESSYNRLNAPPATIVAGATGVSGFPIAVVNSSGAIITETIFPISCYTDVNNSNVFG
jgi:hypothetical protein